MNNFKPCGLNPIVKNPNINITYDDVLAMTDDEFVEYITIMRAEVYRLWKNEGIPPSRGWSEDDVTDDFRDLAGFNTSKLWKVDELSGRRVIHNTHVLGNSVNAWNLDKMLRVRINYTEGDNGRSIFDFFAKDDLFQRYIPYAKRHFLRDSFYFFAQTVKKGDSLPHHDDLKPQTAVEYIAMFNKHTRPYGTHELLIEPKPVDKAYTGYAEHLRDAEFFALTRDEIRLVMEDYQAIPRIALRLIEPKHRQDKDNQYLYHVRLYEKGQRLFPAMFKSFRVSMCQYAVNYPPMTAKALYEHFLPKTQAHVVVWDPSAGWAGRILGAMATNLTQADGTGITLHYIGTDPNPAFYANGTSMYASVAEFYNHIRESESLWDERHTFKVYPCGSEVVRAVPAFQAYKGKLDLVFTSPPYFAKEAYSEDENQSYKKFPAYDDWKTGFLEKTLATAYEWLNHDRYLLWNIANVKFGNITRDIEADSIEICKKLGFEHTETILMSLRGMPGANRVNDDGTATTHNQCRVDGRRLKFEPVYVFRKP
jgi:hypothetical protein